MRAPGPIIVFDAMCVLCSGSAQFVLTHDRDGVFRLASMQSEVGTALYKKFGLDPRDPESMLVVDGDIALRGSDAVLVIAAGLGWPWKAAAALKLAPRPLRDAFYGWIARNRYRLFGRRDVCWVPSRAQAGRLL